MRHRNFRCFNEAPVRLPYTYKHHADRRGPPRRAEELTDRILERRNVDNGAADAARTSRLWVLIRPL
jgi:hypothetical protein